eukprot:3911880-Pleurochrysis_carterae.AAC.2
MCDCLRADKIKAKARKEETLFYRTAALAPATYVRKQYHLGKVHRSTCLVCSFRLESGSRDLAWVERAISFIHLVELFGIRKFGERVYYSDIHVSRKTSIAAVLKLSFKQTVGDTPLLKGRARSDTVTETASLILRTPELAPSGAGSKSGRAGWGAPARWLLVRGGAQARSAIAQRQIQNFGSGARALHEYACAASLKRRTVHVSVDLQMKGARDDYL